MNLKVTTKELDRVLASLAAPRSGLTPPHLIEERDALVGALKPRVDAALAAVNGNASAFTITTFHEVLDVARDAEDTLAGRAVTQGSRVGTVVNYRPAGPSASRYKYAALSTWITLRRVADGWRLTDVTRAEVRPKAPARLRIRITDAAREDVVRNALAPFTTED